jgi:hypothetical protein
MERQLALAIIGASVYFVLVGAGSIVAALLLLEQTRSSDLARVAALALAGGALGATVRALYEVMMRLEDGLWELADGTIVRRSLRRRARAREAYLLEQSRRRTGSGAVKPVEDEPDERPADEEADPREAGRWLSEGERAELAAREAERRALGLTKTEYAVLRQAEDDAERAYGFGVLDLPLLILLPLLGAALGLVAFAGLVGGFLIASGSDSPSYSPAGLFFVAALAGMFAPNFIASLARAADAIFGKTARPPGPSP